MFQKIGLRFRKVDLVYFFLGAMLPIAVLFAVYSFVKADSPLEHTHFFSLLASGSGQGIFYFFVALVEEVLFRGLVFGLLLQTGRSKIFSSLIAALVFSLPHMLNHDTIPLPMMFLFPFLYGLFANALFYATKSIWMATGFHWLWNAIIARLFLSTNTQSLIYAPILTAMTILILLAWIVIQKTQPPQKRPQPTNGGIKK